MERGETHKKHKSGVTGILAESCHPTDRLLIGHLRADYDTFIFRFILLDSNGGVMATALYKPSSER